MYDDAALQPPDAPPSGRKPTQFECVTVLSDVQVRDLSPPPLRGSRHQTRCV